MPFILNFHEYVSFAAEDIRGRQTHLYDEDPRFESVRAVNTEITVSSHVTQCNFCGELMPMILRADPYEVKKVG
jgi:hypothetical protein